MLINFKGIKVVFLTKECFNNVVEVGLSEKHEAEKAIPFNRNFKDFFRLTNKLILIKL